MSFSNRKPRIDFAIIGAQKSATTALQYYLHEHSSVYLPLGEFACFESPDFEQGRVERQIDFSDVLPGMLTGIKRPTIFSDLYAVDRLKDHSPDCRLIMICREPIGRFVSAYFHLMNSGKIPVMDINRAIEEMFRGKYLSRYAAGASLLRNGIYHDSLMHIKAVYGQDSLFVVSQDSIKRDFESVMRDLCDFLEIPFHSVKPPKKREKNLGSYDYRRAFFLKFSNPLIYSYSLGRSRKEYRDLIVLRNFGRGLSALFRRWPFVSPSNRERLLVSESECLLNAYYARDREKLLRDFSDVVYW